MNIVKSLGVAAAFVLLAGQGQAQDAGKRMTTYYVGGGQEITDNSLKNDDAPFSVGVMLQAPSKFILGFDLGFEGTMINSTYGQNNNLSQGMSYNLLVGGNLVDNGNFKTDAALLIGMRETVADCPDSYLGYQCYANTDPNYEYAANFGAVVTMSLNNVLLGVRATGESTQLIAGIRF